MLDTGVLSDSVRYYHEADPFTEKNLYYIPHAGQYHCNSEYEVRRTHLDVCQAIVVDTAGKFIQPLPVLLFCWIVANRTAITPALRT